MKQKEELKEGLYFVHGYYSHQQEVVDTREIFRNHMILMKDSIENVYDVDAYDINLREVSMQSQILSGEYIYYNGETFQNAEENPTTVMYKEINKQLVKSIGYENYGNQPLEGVEKTSDVYSYHVNVGHGNCSIVVFSQNGKYVMWMIDCSVFDYTNKMSHKSNLNACMNVINREFGVNKISKLLITHLHYDHINGIEYLIKKGWVDRDTEVWMNVQYPWTQPTYSRILSQLKALGVKFIDPIVGNSIQHIRILYPVVSYNKKNVAPDNNINNSSVLYQICLAGKSMLFTGDIETEGWEKVTECFPYMKKSTYYCISHHGSITGHMRNKCIEPRCRHISTLADCCSSSTEMQVLMGRNGAYRGIFSGAVISDFPNIIKTEDAKNYIKIEWSSGKISKG